MSWDDNLKGRHNSPLLPKSIRGLIVGKSGCGKTTLLLNLLLRPGWLDYNNLKVFGKSLFQPEYKIIKTAFEKKLPKELIVELFNMKDEIKEIAEKAALLASSPTGRAQPAGDPVRYNELITDPTKILEEVAKNHCATYNAARASPAGSELVSSSEREDKTITCEFYDSADDVPDPANLDKSKNNLMIFDDLQLCRQGKCETYYVRGRHSNVDCFYLAQNYFKLPRQSIRENANFICLFPQDQKNVSHIYNDHASTDMHLEEFKDLCKRAWEIPHGFLVIDLSSHKFKGKYRCGLDLFYIPQS